VHKQAVIATFVTTYKGMKLHVIERKRKREKKQKEETDHYK